MDGFRSKSAGNFHTFAFVAPSSLPTPPKLQQARHQTRTGNKRPQNQTKAQHRKKTAESHKTGHVVRCRVVNVGLCRDDDRLLRHTRVFGAQLFHQLDVEQQPTYQRRLHTDLLQRFPTFCFVEARLEKEGGEGCGEQKGNARMRKQRCEGAGIFDGSSETTRFRLAVDHFTVLQRQQ